MKLGTVVLSPCEVTSAATVPKGAQLETSSGHTIWARRVVFATGYEVVKGIPCDSFEIISSWAIATKPLAEAEFWRDRCLIWEASDPYLYARTTADNRILVGGADQKLTSPGRRRQAIPKKSAQLLDKIQTLLGNRDLEIEYRWAGAFANSPTGLPVFKHLTSLPCAMAILGCGGNGITFSMIAAQVISKWVAGRSDADLDLFQGKQR